MSRARRRRARALALALGAALGAAVACGGGADAPAPDAGPRGGTARMADTLAALAAQLRAAPMPNAFLNRERVRVLRASLPGLTGGAALNARHQLADELLRAGETREAIAELEGLLREAGLDGGTITPRTKPVFELLALAYLRLGEQENCLGDGTGHGSGDVCILPLDGAARHVRQEGARGAIARYGQLLRAFPDDHGSRYLLNVAWLALGGYPDSIPPAHRIPGLAPRAGDPFPRYRNVAGPAGLALVGLAGGASVEDFDGDGLLDVLMTSWEIGDPVRLLMADGRGGYAERSAQAGLAGITGGLNTTHADYDNDGDVDVLVLRGAWLGVDGALPNSLLRNRGDGTFEDVTYAAGLGCEHPTQVGVWADVNLDGHLDLFVGNESGTGAGGPAHPSELFLGSANGTFTEVARQVGLDLDAFVKGATWGDVDNDGRPDLYVSVLGGRNRLYVNVGGGAHGVRFEERAAAAGVERPLASFPTWFWDVDDDGWDDLLVLSYDLSAPLHEMVAREYLGLPLETTGEGGRTVRPEHSRLFRNRGDGTFEDASARMGLDRLAIHAMGSNFGDVDNDGWLDAYVGTGNPDLRAVIPNRMLRNVGGRRFEDVTLPGGFGHVQKGHAAAFADLDRDGDADVLMVLGGAYQGDRFTRALFENPGWPANAWIGLELEGRTANRSAIGARVEVDVADAAGAVRTIHRTVGTGGSFGAGSLRLHVGLGPAATVRAVRVRWPDAAGTRTAYADLAPRRSWRIVQGEAPVALDRPPVPFRGGPAADAHADH